MFSVKTPPAIARALHTRLSAAGWIPSRPGKVLLAPLKHTPYILQTGLLRKALLTTCGRGIADGDFDSLIGRWVKITVVDLGLSWSIGLTHKRELQLKRIDNADTEIRGDAAAFILIAGRQSDPDTLFFQRRITLSGDTELGHEMKNLLDAVELDDLPAPVLGLLEFVSAKLLQLEKRCAERHLYPLYWYRPYLSDQCSVLN